MTELDRRPEEWPPDGQGEPLPEAVADAAQWIWRNRLYLYRGTEGATARASFTRGAQLTDGSWCPGVDASLLAPQLRMTVDELFAHNRAGTLFIAARRDPPARGGTSATTYRFRVGDVEVLMTFEEGIPETRA
jgi:hypothetical protein